MFEYHRIAAAPATGDAHGALKPGDLSPFSHPIRDRVLG